PDPRRAAVFAGVQRAVVVGDRFGDHAAVDVAHEDPVAGVFMGEVGVALVAHRGASPDRHFRVRVARGLRVFDAVDVHAVVAVRAGLAVVDRDAAVAALGAVARGAVHGDPGEAEAFGRNPRHADRPQADAAEQVVEHEHAAARVGARAAA